MRGILNGAVCLCTAGGVAFAFGDCCVCIDQGLVWTFVAGSLQMDTKWIMKLLVWRRRAPWSGAWFESWSQCTVCVIEFLHMDQWYMRRDHVVAVRSVQLSAGLVGKAYVWLGAWVVHHWSA